MIFSLSLPFIVQFSGDKGKHLMALCFPFIFFKLLQRLRDSCPLFTLINKKSEAVLIFQTKNTYLSPTHFFFFFCMQRWCNNGWTKIFQRDQQDVRLHYSVRQIYLICSAVKRRLVAGWWEHTGRTRNKKLKASAEFR